MGSEHHDTIDFIALYAVKELVLANELVLDLGKREL